MQIDQHVHLILKKLKVVLKQIEKSDWECFFFVEICSQEQDAGPCRGTYNRYSFDRNRAACVQFVYGGCRGNQNNFLTSEECSAMCIRTRGFNNQS